MGQGSPGRFSLERWTIRLAPALGMAAIVSSALLMTEAEPRWAQVFAGPTDHSGRLAWRLAVKRGSLERQFPITGTVNIVVAFADKSQVRRDIALDDDGLGWVSFDRPASGLHEHLSVTVREGTRVLTEGPVFVSEQQWQSGQRLEGGWCPGHHEGSREIQVGVVDGVVLHARPADVVVALSEHGKPLLNERFAVTADGADLFQPSPTAKDPEARDKLNLFTDEHGIARFTIRTSDVAPVLHVTSGSPPHESHFTGTLPIRPGGLGIAKKGDTLEVSSSIGLEQASIGLLTQYGLVDVKTIQLKREAGVTSATVKYDFWPPKPLWAMVSSEPQLDAGNTIGWPLLDPAERAEPHLSRVVPNRLVLDGYRSVTARLERQRHRVWATSSVALILVGLLLAFAVIRSSAQDRAQMRPLDRLLAEETGTSVSERTPYALIAVVVLTSATVVLTWWVSLLR